MENRIKATVVPPRLDEDGKPVLTTIILANFENGYLKKGSLNDVPISYKKAEDSNDRILTIPGHGKLSYVGRTKSRSGDKGSVYNIGCLDTKTGKMTIHDVEMFRMKPTFEDEEKAELVFDDSLTERQKIDRLDAAFGSSKKKRAVNSRRQFSEQYGEKYNEAMDTAIEHALTQPQVHDTIDSPSTPSRTAVSTDIRPPYNEDVENPQEVYTSTNLIPPESMIALQSPADIFFKRTKEQLTEWTDTKKYPWYILDQLKLMPLGEKQRWEKAKCLMYLNYMLKLFKFKPADFKKPNCLPAEWPEAVKKEILQQFTMKSVASKGQRSVRHFPARLKDKLLLYILAMSLIIDEAQLDPVLLIQDLAVTEKKISQFYRNLGCIVSSQQSAAKKRESGQPTVILKLPFKRPTDTKPIRGTSKRNLLNR